MYQVPIPHPQPWNQNHAGVLWPDSTWETSQRKSLPQIGPAPVMAEDLEYTLLQQT